ncbi:hypothetical protein [Actinopolymorpha alba]|uniref:hypothetical protein n=1 Tax=Actinopolymorpha alba TaxID=533267 RepID=UPI00037B9F82|nr:hypothetical protein [Actinopolymorpha alba]
MTAAGFATFKGQEFLALRLADGAATRRLRFFLHPSWSEELGAVVLGRLDTFPTPRAEIQQVFREYAGDRWKGQLPAS